MNWQRKPQIFLNILCILAYWNRHRHRISRILLPFMFLSCPIFFSFVAKRSTAVVNFPAILYFRQLQGIAFSFSFTQFYIQILTQIKLMYYDELHKNKRVNFKKSDYGYAEFKL